MGVWSDQRRLQRKSSSSINNTTGSNNNNKGGNKKSIILAFVLGLGLGRSSVGPATPVQSSSGSASSSTSRAVSQTNAVASSNSPPRQLRPMATTQESDQASSSVTLSAAKTTSTETTSLSSTVSVSTNQKPAFVRDFTAIAVKYNTDKATGPNKFEACLKDKTKCERPEAYKPRCRIVGHFYHEVYQRWLGNDESFSGDQTQPFQFLEIGVGQGRSVPTWKEFLPKAETHFMDGACVPATRDKNAPHLKQLYDQLDDMNRLHCGNSASYEFLKETYQKMRRPDAPPLRIVIDDASHIPAHIAVALFFWLPRLEPGGLLFLEDIEPNVSTRHGGHKIQTDLLPQLIHDVHFCGDNEKTEDPPCFPQLVNLIQSVHCDLHICVIQRTSDVPSFEPPSKEESMPPPHALDLRHCLGNRSSV